MRSFFQYLWYIVRHKWYVLLAGLKTRAPLWLLLIHDISKFSPEEFQPYREFFYEPEKANDEVMRSFGLFGAAELAPFGYYIKDRFNVAWLLHQNRNPHHWQYWVLLQDDGPAFPLPMPERYAREMVADWAGAGRAITGAWGVANWYQKNKHKIQLYPDTRIFVEELIDACYPSPDSCAYHCEDCKGHGVRFCSNCLKCFREQMQIEHGITWGNFAQPGPQRK